MKLLQRAGIAVSAGVLDAECRSQLEPDARMLVALRDIEGLSYEEIIEITELAEGTVKSRLHRAREKLADLLGRLEE